MKEIYSERNRRFIFNKCHAVVGYFIAGYPDTDSFPDVIRKAVKSGIGILEVGYPSEDPFDDGEVIRKAHSLVDRSAVSEISYWKKIRGSVEIPIWIMGYKADLIDSGKYLELSREGCADAFVITDLSKEESIKLQNEVKPFGVDVIGLIGPSIAMRDGLDILETFPIVYQRLYDGPTGMDVNAEDFKSILETGHRFEDTYMFAGFGINSRARVKELFDSGFDGVVIGTAIMRSLNRSVSDMEQFIKEISGIG